MTTDDIIRQQVEQEIEAQQRAEALAETPEPVVPSLVVPSETTVDPVTGLPFVPFAPPPTEDKTETKPVVEPTPTETVTPVTAVVSPEEQRIQDLQAGLDYVSRVESGEIQLEPGDPTIEELRASKVDIEAKLDALKQAEDIEKAYADAGVTIPDDVKEQLGIMKALALSPASPFIDFSKGTLDIESAILAGVDIAELERLGVTPEQIKQAEDYNTLRLKYGGNPLEAIEGGDVELVRKIYGDTATMDMQITVAERRDYEREILPLMPKEFQQAYRENDIKKLEQLEREYKIIEVALQPYVIDNSLNIVEYLRDNPTGSAESDLLKLGYSQEQIDEAKEYNITFTKLEPFKNADGSYNLVSALSQGVIRELDLDRLGFSKEDITSIVNATEKTGEKPTYNEDTGLWYDPSTQTYYDKFGMIFYNTKGEITGYNFSHILPEDTIAGQIAIALTPIAGTVYFWRDMKPWQQAISIIGDVLILDSIFNAGRLTTAITKLLARPITSLVVKEPKFSKVVGKVTDEMMTILKKAGVGDEYKDVVKAQLKYGDDYVELKRVETVLDTLKSQEISKTTPYYRVLQDEIKSAESAYQKALRNTSISKQQLEDTSQLLVKRVAGTVGGDDPRAFESFKRMSRDIIKHTENLADDFYNRLYLGSNLDDLTAQIKAKEAELARLRVKYATSPSSYVDVVEDLSRLRAKKIMAMMGNVEELQEQLIATRTFIKQARAELAKMEKDKLVTPYKSTLQAELKEALKQELALQTKIDDAIKAMEVEASRYKPYGGASPRTEVGTFPKISPSIPSTGTAKAGIGVATLVYAIGKIFPTNKIIKITEIEPLITEITKIITTALPDITPMQKQDINKIVRELVDIHNKAVRDGATDIEARESVVAKISEAISVRPAIAVTPAISTVPITDTVLRAITEPAVRPATPTLTAVQIAPAISTITKTPPIKIEAFARPISASPMSQPIPVGSITWAQGARKGVRGELVPQWFYIPPPYNQSKPIPLSAPPTGAKNRDSLKPSETLQIIGKSRAKVPRRVTVDLGWADIYILNGREIRFESGGEMTNIGSRVPSTTQGMDVENGVIYPPRKALNLADPEIAELLGLEDEVETEVKKPVTRYKMSTKRPPRKVKYAGGESFTLGEITGL